MAGKRPKLLTVYSYAYARKKQILFPQVAYVDQAF